MASPFHAFRKHQKALLVATGLMAMIAFVFVPQWGSMGGGGDGSDRAVISSRHGTVNEKDLQRMVQTRHVLKDFLDAAYQKAVLQQGQPEVYPLISYDTPINEQSTIDTMLAARKAEELGFMVNNDVINTYLRKLTAGKLSSKDISDLLTGYQIQDRTVSIESIFSAIREEMLADKLRETYDVTVAVTPGQRWQHYLQLRDRVRVELLPVPVSKFLSQVPDPTPQEVEKFYNEYKERSETPDMEYNVRMGSPEPGFKLPPRAQFQFFKADYDAFVELVQSEITTEEIEKYYNDNKERLFKRATLLDDEEPKAQPVEPKDEPAKEEPAPEEPKSEDAKPTEPKSDEPKSETPPGDEAKSDEKSDESKPAAPQDEPATDKDEKQAAEDKLSANFDLARDTQFINADEPAESEAETPTEPAAKEKPAAEIEASEDKKPEPKDTETGSDDDKPAAKDPAGDLQDEAAPATEPATKAPAAKPVEFIPLSEAEDDIRKSLARERAAAKIDAILAPITVKLQAYSMSRKSAKDKDQPAAATPDMVAIAKANHLSLEETELISVYQLVEIPLGESRVVSESAPFSRAPMFAPYAFQNLPRLFAPVLTQDDAGNRYLIWKIAQADEQVPPLDEIRPQVIEAWKVLKARELALAEAERLAKVASEHKDSLSEVFSDKKDLQFITTEPFSWLTMGAVPGDFSRPIIRLSEIDGVDGADMAFMKKIFSLKDGEVAVVMNHGKTDAYVVRMIGHEEPTSELRKKFLGQPGPWLQMAAQQNNQAVIDALHGEIEAEAKLSKKRDLDQRDPG